jgi:hypothetical protein
MIRVFHDQAGRRNRVHDPFDRGDRSGFEVGPFHDRGVHPLYPVQLAIRSSSRIEQPRLLQETDCTFNGDQRRTSPREGGIAGRERIGQTGGLRRRQTSETGTSVGKNDGTDIVQFRRRSRACR